MEFPTQLEKICHFNTRKLLLLITTIASFLLIFQFFSIPYGTLLPSLFPTTSSTPQRDPTLAYTISSFTNSSESDFGPNTTKRRPDYTSGKDVEPQNLFSTHQVIDLIITSGPGTVEISLNSSISQKVTKPGHENVHKTDTPMKLERPTSEDSGSVPLTAALPPQLSSNNLTSPSKTVSNFTTSVTSNNNSTVTSNLTHNAKLVTPSTPTTSIADMNYLLLKSHASSRSMIPRWHSVRDQEILLAKSQIENPPILVKEQELYASLFHNVSMFKRSYELMEQTLKVYTYKEGAKPIFHQPETKGIYASEGWFMKQMEGNRQFSVNDPRKAHLFYLPFSTRRLEQFLYVPNSHSHKNLVAYLKSYLDLISSKYPFWNRTGGADHVVVACHDWAPAETRQHMSSCIRVLCNADISEDFVMGKDASLPETNVHLAKDPLRGLGGKPASERQILAFFAGSMHGYVRPILLQYWENKDPDIKIYGHMGRSSKSRGDYVQYMKSSKYCICAKGHEVNSPRVVEAIFYECVPVIISDNFVPPFFEVLNWEKFAVFIAEKDIPNLKSILLSVPDEKYKELHKMVRKVQQHFLWHTKPVKYDIFHMILHSIWYNRVFQVYIA